MVDADEYASNVGAAGRAGARPVDVDHGDRAARGSIALTSAVRHDDMPPAGGGGNAPRADLHRDATDFRTSVPL
jgi:hypothetical protein